MEDKNLKLKLKSELKNKMPKRIFIELLDDMGIGQELGKNEAVDFIFEKYSNEQVKDLILKIIMIMSLRNWTALLIWVIYYPIRTKRITI